MNAAQSAIQRIEEAAWFHRVVLLSIALAGVLVGLETDARIRQSFAPWLKAADLLIVVVFTLEVLVHLAARGRRWSDYFRDPWNVFDFVIVALCWVPMENSFAPVLRLVRVLRVLRLIPNVPQLQTLVSALLRSVPPMTYIGLLLVLLFYVYAVIGVSVFGANDPVHFGTLPKAMLTLFQVSTLENWSEILKIEMLGSARFGYEGMEHMAVGSKAQPMAAVAYFVSFIMLGTMIILNLLIGVVVNSMTEARVEVERTQRDRHQLQFGRPSLEDEINQAEQQLVALQKQMQILRHRLKE